MDRRVGGGGMGDLPWASVFDSAANAAALSAIQGEGFRAASELVDRFVRKAGVADDTGGPTPAAALPRSMEQRENAFGAMDLEPLMRSWWSMVGQFLLGSDNSNPTGASEVALDLAGDTVGGSLELGATIPGIATAEVWLHNRTAQDLGEVRLRCSDLMANAGSLIHSDEVRIDPYVVPMPPRCSRGVGVEVKVSQDISAGVYRGNLLVEEHVDLWLPVKLTVRAQAT